MDQALFTMKYQELRQYARDLGINNFVGKPKKEQILEAIKLHYENMQKLSSSSRPTANITTPIIPKASIIATLEENNNDKENELCKTKSRSVGSRRTTAKQNPFATPMPSSPPPTRQPQALTPIDDIEATLVSKTAALAIEHSATNMLTDESTRKKKTSSKKTTTVAISKETTFVEKQHKEAIELNLQSINSQTEQQSNEIEEHSNNRKSSRLKSSNKSSNTSSTASTEPLIMSKTTRSSLKEDEEEAVEKSTSKKKSTRTVKKKMIKRQERVEEEEQIAIQINSHEQMEQPELDKDIQKCHEQEEPEAEKKPRKKKNLNAHFSDEVTDSVGLIQQRVDAPIEPLPQLIKITNRIEPQPQVFTMADQQPSPMKQNVIDQIVESYANENQVEMDLEEEQPIQQPINQPIEQSSKNQTYQDQVQEKYYEQAQFEVTEANQTMINETTKQLVLNNSSLITNDEDSNTTSSVDETKQNVVVNEPIENKCITKEDMAPQQDVEIPKDNNQAQVTNDVFENEHSPNITRDLSDTFTKYNEPNLIEPDPKNGPNLIEPELKNGINNRESAVEPFEKEQQPESVVETKKDEVQSCEPIVEPKPRQGGARIVKPKQKVEVISKAINKQGDEEIIVAKQVVEIVRREAGPRIVKPVIIVEENEEKTKRKNFENGDTKKIKKQNETAQIKFNKKEESNDSTTLKSNANPSSTSSMAHHLKPNTDPKQPIKKASKAPDFKEIHQKEFQRMESVTSYSRRIEERHQKLTRRRRSKTTSDLLKGPLNDQSDKHSTISYLNTISSTDTNSNARQAESQFNTTVVKSIAPLVEAAQEVESTGSDVINMMKLQSKQKQHLHETCSTPKLNKTETIVPNKIMNLTITAQETNSIHVPIKTPNNNENLERKAQFAKTPLSSLAKPKNLLRSSIKPSNAASVYHINNNNNKGFKFESHNLESNINFSGGCAFNNASAASITSTSTTSANIGASCTLTNSTSTHSNQTSTHFSANPPTNSFSRRKSYDPNSSIMRPLNYNPHVGRLKPVEISTKSIYLESTEQGKKNNSNRLFSDKLNTTIKQSRNMNDTVLLSSIKMPKVANERRESLFAQRQAFKQSVRLVKPNSGNLNESIMDQNTEPSMKAFESKLLNIKRKQKRNLQQEASRINQLNESSINNSSMDSN